MRVLYVPNEDGAFRQDGFRRPFANLLTAGLLESVSVFSLQMRIRGGGAAEDHRNGLVSRVREFRPDLVLMQHVGATGLRDRHLEEMRSAGKFALVYHEGDPYSRWLHPLPAAARAVARYSDVVFTVGSGTFLENFRRLGVRDVRWEPHVVETERYRYRPIVEPSHRTHDVVVVANRNTPRLRGHPQWRERIEFVQRIQDTFGDRAAIFGRGWSGPGASGPVAFDDQQDAIRTAWISANWDHYAREPNYYSNRLPISLAAGTVHATTWHPGYEIIFPPEARDFLLTATTPAELVRVIRKAIDELDVPELKRRARSAQRFAYSSCRQDEQLVRFMNFDKTRVDAAAASASWNEDELGVAET